MFDRLVKLKELGYCPDAVLDLGAHQGHWTTAMRNIFSDSEYYLFEANDYTELRRFNGDPKIKVYNNTILNDKIEEVDWYKIQGTGDSMFKEKTHHYNDCEIVKRETVDLDTHVLRNGILQDSKNILIKIDCQGAEIPILRGATSILTKTSFIILEIPLFGRYNENVPTFLEHITFMDSIGFVSYEILESHILNNFSFQVDMLFINKNHHFNELVNEKFLQK